MYSCNGKSGSRGVRVGMSNLNLQTGKGREASYKLRRIRISRFRGTKVDTRNKYTTVVRVPNVQTKTGANASQVIYALELRDDNSSKKQVLIVQLKAEIQVGISLSIK